AAAGQSPTSASDARRRDEAPKPTADEIAITESFLPDVRFVESGDNPAVHEVGAGMADMTHDGTEPPILVIENRQQRIGSHIARVDSPQQPGREIRGFRRLFTHARKS